jgi:oxygen-independent coproporphyrinogen-3 oxidase
VAKKPLAGLYLHVPFCARICPYCDFAVRTGDRERRRAFVEHLLAEIDLHADNSLEFDTIYFGGGTPSCLEPEDLARIIQRVRARLHTAADTQIFLEANPEDVSRESVAAWRQLGVATLSLGIQSLKQEGLEFLGRLHDPQAAERSVSLSRGAGFRTVSLDLIYGLPGQSAADWKDELDHALALQPDHISCYQLTIHPGTRFGAMEKRGTLTQLSSDAQGELFHLAHRHLNASGMQGYEVSQFAATPEHRSRHNQKYWDHSPYLGLGPSAHSYATHRRWWNFRKTSTWQQKIGEGVRPVEETETLDARALTLEALMTGLRTYGGVDLEQIHRRWGVELRSTNADHIHRLTAEGLVTVQEDRLIPTRDGLAVADSLARGFELFTEGETNHG